LAAADTHYAQSRGMIFPTAITKQPQINAAVSDIVRLLAPDVVQIRYSVDQDWSGEWAIFFRIVLADDAARNRLRDVRAKVVSGLGQRLDFDSLGVFVYHDFRSVSEQEKLQEPAWA